MSNHATGLVWKSGLYEAADLLVALKLADYADDDGWSWPAMSTLAKQTGLAPRSVRRIVRRMQMDAMLTVEERRGRGRVNRYRLMLEKFEAAGKAWKAMDCQTRFETLKRMTQSPIFLALKGDRESGFLIIKPDSGDIKPDSDDRKTGPGSPIESFRNPSEETRARDDAPRFELERWRQARAEIRQRIGQDAFVRGVSALALKDGLPTAPNAAEARAIAERHAPALKAAGLVAIFTEDGQGVRL